MRKKKFPLSEVYRLLEPGPVVLLTTIRAGRANVMPMSWHLMMEFTPPLVGCVVSNGNYSFASLKKSRECVINIPTVELAKIRGCKVIGSAGSMEKVKFLREECGFDIAFDYKTGPVVEQLKVEAPDGIDVYFDNVGGEALEAALSMLRVHGRIIACGGISGYNEEKPRPGPSNLFNVTTKRLTMKGLIVRDWLDRQREFEKEVSGYLQSGKLKNKETVVEGLDQAEEAFIGLFTGNNIGKMVVKLT